jgi:hypothetical protein
VKTRPHFFLFALMMGLLAACSKPQPDPAAANPAPPPERKGNWAEAMGINPEGESLGRDTPPPAKPPAAAPPGPEAKPIRRTLKAADGRALDALLLSRTDTTVSVRRQADGKEFVIPLEKLSPGDRDFIRTSALPVTAGR